MNGNLLEKYVVRSGKVFLGVLRQKKYKSPINLCRVRVFASNRGQITTSISAILCVIDQW